VLADPHQGAPKAARPTAARAQIYVGARQQIRKRMHLNKIYMYNMNISLFICE
jgi:hypothetical protein